MIRIITLVVCLSFATVSFGKDQANLLTEKQFDKSPVGVVYKCYLVAVRANLNQEASVLASVINKFRKNDPEFSLNHKIYLIYAAEELTRIENEAGGDFKSFFNYVCKKPTNNMRQMLDDGML